MEMKLYEIDRALMEAFEKAIDPETGEIVDEGAYEEFCQFEMAFNDKVDNVIKIIKKLKAYADQIKAVKQSEMERYTKLQKSTDKEIENLKNYLAMCLHGEKFKSLVGSVSYKDVKSVEVNIPAIELPSHLCRWKDPEPDKTAIKAELEAGKEIAGCRLVERRSVIVK